MQKQARHNAGVHQAIFRMSAGETNQLVAYTCNNGHQHNTGSNALEQAGPAQKGKDEHADEHDDHQKVGATAGVQCAKGAHIFDLQGQACLVGINGFMLRPVVLKDALNILHRRNSCDVAQKNHHPQYALGKVQEHGIIGQRVHKAHGPGGHYNEQANGQRHRGQNSEHHFFIR